MRARRDTGLEAQSRVRLRLTHEQGCARRRALRALSRRGRRHRFARVGVRVPGNVRDVPRAVGAGGAI